VYVGGGELLHDTKNQGFGVVCGWFKILEKTRLILLLRNKKLQLMEDPLPGNNVFSY
jgi:hypothetical protein